MKNYEKKYKEALEKIKRYVTDEFGCTRLKPSDIFSELAESEDERIRKTLLGYFKDQDNQYTFRGLTNDEVISWLEKQGEQHPKFRIGDTIEKKSTGDIVTISEIDLKNREYRLSNTGFIPFKYENLWELVEQKPTDKVKPKFHEGEWIITNKKHIWYVDETPETTSYLYRLINQYGKVEVAEFEVVDEKARLWTIKDAKDGDVLACKDELILFKSYDNKNLCYYCWYNGQTNHFFPKDSHTSKPRLDIIVPATKEQRDLLFQKMKEAGYEWDVDKVAKSV